jgi:cell division protein FtsI/penicillin-binding protein 2
VTLFSFSYIMEAMSSSWRGHRPKTNDATEQQRLTWVLGGFALAGVLLLGRFFQLQVLEYKSYQVLASDQHVIQKALTPRRGTIYLRDRLDGTLYPVAKDRDAWQIYAVPREMKDGTSVAEKLAGILGRAKEEFVPLFTSPTGTYQVIERDAALPAVEAIREANLPGIGVQKGLTRLYPEAGIGGQLLGFVSLDEKNQRVGRYGIEGYYDDVLRGTSGEIHAEQDAAGRRLTIGSIDIKKAQNGSDLVLTIDRAIQYQACAKIKEAVNRFEASGGTIIVVDPHDGSLLAMCSAPDFDPTTFRTEKDVAIFNNPAIFYQYEPGSIFKAVTISAGLDAGKISPQTTYNDTGEEKIDQFTIRNSDKKAHGLQTMTEVLEKSLNTGTIFVERLLGAETFRSYVERFGFGQKTGVPLSTEVKGSVAPLQKKGAIFAATTSFGQGMAATPLQMAMSYVPMGNGGKLYKARLVETIIHPDQSREHPPIAKPLEVISPRTSQLISAMLVNVVENGHGKHAAVPGYYVGGKTGTAQIPNPNGQGYLQDATIGSFVGYAPAEDPKFVMLVKLDRPKNVEYAESSAAPVFGEMASFLLSYLQVPPERPIKTAPQPVTIPVPPVFAPTSTREQ